MVDLLRVVAVISVLCGVVGFIAVSPIGGSNDFDLQMKKISCLSENVRRSASGLPQKNCELIYTARKAGKRASWLVAVYVLISSLISGILFGVFASLLAGVQDIRNLLTAQVQGAGGRVGKGSTAKTKRGQQFETSSWNVEQVAAEAIKDAIAEGLGPEQQRLSAAQAVREHDPQIELVDSLIMAEKAQQKLEKS